MRNTQGQEFTDLGWKRDLLKTEIKVRFDCRMAMEMALNRSEVMNTPDYKHLAVNYISSDTPNRVGSLLYAKVPSLGL